jgi:hypothetical protein
MAELLRLLLTDLIDRHREGQDFDCQDSNHWYVVCRDRDWPTDLRKPPAVADRPNGFRLRVG